MKSKYLLFSITIKDCEVQTFTVPGHGGSGKDTSNTGVRIVHKASGASGRAVDTRSQKKNKELAFKRMAESKTFKAWHKLECARRLGQPTIDEIIDQQMQDSNLLIEYADSRTLQDSYSIKEWQSGNVRNPPQ